ncbi:MAG: prephenate dehydrogenase/arogenate dehydrogenase family protein, partial [Alphaproteobacteria bacterium]
MTAPLFRRMALIGLGLIGSSLGHVAKREGLAGHIAGSARSARTRDKALEIGFVDSVHADPRDAVAGADLVILCSPVGTYGDLAAQIAPALAPGAFVSDVGSVELAV